MEGGVASKEFFFVLVTQPTNFVLYYCGCPIIGSVIISAYSHTLPLRWHILICVQNVIFGYCGSKIGVITDLYDLYCSHEELKIVVESSGVWSDMLPQFQIHLQTRVQSKDYHPLLDIPSLSPNLQ